MLKAVGVFLVFAASMGLGFQESYKLSEHIQALEDFLQVLICLKGEIRYGGSSLPEAFRESAVHCAGNYDRFLTAVSEKMENRQEEDPGRIVRQCAEEHLKELQVSTEERERITQLGERLGYLDREMQIRQLSLYESEFERMIQKAKADAPAKKKLYHSLGVFCGVMLAILFW